MPDFTTQPLNYQTDVANPFQAAMQGYQAGAAIRNDQQQQQQQQLALQAQQQQQQVLQALVNNPNPTAQDYARASLMVPGMKDQINQSWNQLNPAQQQGHLNDASQYYAAVVNGHPDIAVDLMNSKADAMEQAGAPAQQVQQLRLNAQMLKISPSMGRTMTGLMLSNIPGGPEVLKGLQTADTTQQSDAEAPAKLASANADAATKVANAANVGTKIGLENAEGTEKVLSAQAQRQVAAMNTQIQQANSETERGQLILKRDQFVAEQKQLGNTNATASQGQMDAYTDVIDQIGRVMNHPGLSGWGTGATGSLAGKVPGTDAYDFRAALKGLQSQEFIAKLQSLKGAGGKGGTGMGALSNAEGDRLATAIANLDPNQSEQQIRNALGVALANAQKGQARLVTMNPTLPMSGGPVVVKTPTYGAVTEGDINRLMSQHPGSTREQIMQFLQTQGK